MTFHISTATSDDIGTCARIIAKALSDDPVTYDYVRDDRDRLPRLTRLYTASLRIGAANGGTIDIALEPTGDIVGVAAWEGPRTKPVWQRLITQITALPLFVSAVGVANLIPAIRTQRSYESQRPTTAHWYLADIAVTAAARGHGVGSALLTHRINHIDAEQLPAYLEATSEANRRLYERYGFIPGEKITTRTTTLTTMQRPAQQTT